METEKERLQHDIDELDQELYEAMHENYSKPFSDRTISELGGEIAARQERFHKIEGAHI